MDQESAQASMTIAQLGPWIISAIALLQIWVIEIWRRFRKPTIAIYESGNIELGYSTLGPTLGLMGTLRVLHKNAFVERIYVQITRVRDSATHTFNWRFFRSPTIALNQSDPIRLEMASSFLLTQNNPFKYNILFVDETFISENAPKVGHIPAKWIEFRNQRIQELEQEHGHDIMSALIDNPLLLETFFDQFFKDPELVNAYTTLDRAFYWETGNYLMSIIMECSRPNQIFTKNLKFSLSEEDVSLLRLNSIPTLKAMCGFNVVWNFAYPEYKKL